MRRKSSRDLSRKSSDSPKKPGRSTNTRQSSSRSRLCRNSNKEVSENTSIEESQEDSQEVINSVSETVVTNTAQNENHSEIAENSSEELTQQVEENEDLEKGKSNDIFQTNVERCRDIIEPEIENENVQGTAQSPSKDKDENVQIVYDLQTNQEEYEENQQQSLHPIDEEPQKQSEGINFESEYVQGTETNDENCLSNINDFEQEPQDQAEISTTPELVDIPLNRSISNENDLSKLKETTEKKKIVLRRSSPVTERRSSIQEISEKQIKCSSTTSKKITLKRPTIEEKTPSSELKDMKRRSSVLEDEHQRIKRASTSTDERIQESINEETQQKPTTKVKLIRSVSLGFPFVANPESNDSEIVQQTPLRKAAWGKSSNWFDNLTASMYKIDMDSIKIICPSVQFLKENEVKLQSVPKERKKSEAETVVKRKISMENNTSKSEAEEENGKDTSEEESEPEAVKENIIAMNRKISIVDDTAGKLKPPPSPAKNPVSKVLFITNLVRPFTVKQLKELLERTGKIVEDGFWTDRIKSKCYVEYHTDKEAETTRNALHGVNWPIGNGKQLIIDYATEEDMKKAQNPVPPVHHIPERRFPEKENWEPEPLMENRIKDKDRFGDTERRRRSSDREPHRGRETERRNSKSRSRDRIKDKKYAHRSYTPDGHSSIKRQKKEEPAPQKLMDDLFLKTKATPSIYWQPLSPEEIATKQKQRLVRMEEHKRRIEQSRDRRIRDTRRPPYRRR